MSITSYVYKGIIIGLLEVVKRVPDAAVIFLASAEGRTRNARTPGKRNLGVSNDNVVVVVVVTLLLLW